MSMSVSVKAASRRGGGGGGGEGKRQGKEREMFFFFVGGVQQQVRQVLKERAARCIRCGSDAALVEYDNVLKLFFVPVWRWPGNSPALYCNNCSVLLPYRSFSVPPPPEDRGSNSSALSDVLRCHSCARVVDPEFRFCPFCGSSL